MVPTTSSPNLEDFLGGATMGAQESMALSLDSIYYSHNAEPETNRDFLTDPFRQESHDNVQSHPYYSALACHGFFQAPLLEETETKEPHQVTVLPLGAEECFRN